MVIDDPEVGEIKGRRLDNPIQYLRSHIAEDQAVGIGLILAHINLVTDAAGCPGEESRFEIGVEDILPDSGKGAKVTIGAATLAGWNDN